MSEDAQAKDAEATEGEDAVEEVGEEVGEDDFEDGADQAPPPSKSSKMKIIIIAVAAVLVLGGGGAGLWFSGLLTLDSPHTATIDLPEPPTFYEMPKLTVDLMPSGSRLKPYIQLQFRVELEEAAKQAVINNEPRILDMVQSHLRDTTVDALEGKAGTEQLREDLTLIINRVIAPQEIITVRFVTILTR